MPQIAKAPLTARRLIFQLHWLLGITVGLVLAVMGTTGAMLAFEEEIQAGLTETAALAPGVSVLPPAALLDRAVAARPGEAVVRLVVKSDPALPARVSFAAKGDGRRSTLLQDRVDGQLIGPVPGDASFAFIRRLHRWLALPGNGEGIGGQITGIAAISLIFFAISGIYLRWPRRPLAWRSWLRLDLKKSGRNLYRELHAVIGAWACIFYLISAFTGMWWSYSWYRDGLRALLDPRPQNAAAEIAGRPALGLAWEGFERATMGTVYAQVTMIVPAKGAAVQFRALPEATRHNRQDDQIVVDGTSGRLIALERYADRALGPTLLTSMFEIHRGAFFGWPGRVLIFLSSLALPAFTVTGILLYLARRRRTRALAGEEARIAEASGGDALVVYATQSGTAERLARRTAAMLGGARMVPLMKLEPAMLQEAGRAFFVVSTYGEGEPPDDCRGFARRTMAVPPVAGGLRYAVLALGDRDYEDFCAFGHAVDGWLHQGGGQRLFDLIEMNGEDADAQRHWQRQLAMLGAHPELPDWEPAAYQPWHLVERTLLNPGSTGGPAYRLVLEPGAGVAAPVWQPGAIAEILPRHAPQRLAAWLAAAGLPDTAEARAHLAGAILPPPEASPGLLPEAPPPLAHRDYSVASLAESGRIELVVRLYVGPDGLLGVASGYLTQTLQPGAAVQLRLRDNPGFRPPDDPAAPLILIGNGTGIAGLLAHLRARAQSGGGPVWLLHGERSRTCDALYADELAAWLASGVLHRLDRVWSREPDCGRYVQHLVMAQAEPLARWIEGGASVMVCGSLAGMAPAVDAALRVILGDQGLEALSEQGRYRRDVY